MGRSGSARAWLPVAWRCGASWAAKLVVLPQCPDSAQTISMQKNRQAIKQPVSIQAAGFLSFTGEIWWRFTDSNRGPVDYDSIALTD